MKAFLSSCRKGFLESKSFEKESVSLLPFDLSCKLCFAKVFIYTNNKCTIESES